MSDLPDFIDSLLELRDTRYASENLKAVPKKWGKRRAAGSADELILTSSETSVPQTVDARRGQEKFRQALLARIKCCEITKVEVGAVLKASHIKPWAVSSNVERLDHHNGLLLVANVDALFDKGLITFDTSGRLVRSRQITDEQLNALGIDPNGSINIWPKRNTYLDYHRAKVFVK